jgi:HSP20 family protein
MSRSLIPFGTRFGLFEDFRKEMDQLFGHFGQGNGGEGALVHWSPKLNLSESETQYDVEVDLPGLKPEEVNLELKQGDLWITGERKSESEEKGKTWHRVERSYGQFRRVIHLGDDVATESVTAEYKDGVLHVTVPKAEKAKTRKIEIKS